MHKIIDSGNSSSKNDTNKSRKEINSNNINLDKILCNHCGRTANNGIRCLGICVADNDY